MAARMAAALASSRDAVPVAVASSARSRADEFAARFGLAAFDDAAVMARADIDAVYIANRNGQHAETALAAIAAGKPTLCEKPMATSFAETRRVIDAAGRARVLFMEGLWPLHLPAHRRFAQMAREGPIGRAVHLYADFGHLAPRTLFPALYEGDAGVLRDRMVYLVALAVGLFGPACEVSAQVESRSGIPVAAQLTLSHAGAVSQLAASFLAEMGNRAMLACEGGVIALEAPLLASEDVTLIRRSPPSPVQSAPAGLKARLVERIKRAPAARRLRRRFAPVRAFLPYDGDPYHPEIAHFAALIRAGATESPVVPATLSLETSRILDAAIEAR
jgi:predicted dehydrogenase